MGLYRANSSFGLDELLIPKPKAHLNQMGQSCDGGTAQRQLDRVMMLSHSLLQRMPWTRVIELVYKQCTYRVATRLKETAARCGYDSFGALSISHPEKVLKEKAPPSKQENGAEIKNPGTLPMRELPILAEFIFEHLRSSSDLNEFSAVLDALREVISQREEWAGRFKGSGSHN